MIPVALVLPAAAETPRLGPNGSAKQRGATAKL